MLAVVDEEVGLGALRQRILARVRVGRPLGHLPSRSLARLLRSAANRSSVRAWGEGCGGGHGCSGGGGRVGDLRRRRGDEGGGGGAEDETVGGARQIGRAHV